MNGIKPVLKLVVDKISAPTVFSRLLLLRKYPACCEKVPVNTLSLTEFLLSVDSITSPVAIIESTLLTVPLVNSIIAPAVNVAFVLRIILILNVVESNKPV